MRKQEKEDYLSARLSPDGIPLQRVISMLSWWSVCCIFLLRTILIAYEYVTILQFFIHCVDSLNTKVLPQFLEKGMIECVISKYFWSFIMHIFSAHSFYLSHFNISLRLIARFSFIPTLAVDFQAVYWEMWCKIIQQFCAYDGMLLSSSTVAFWFTERFENAVYSFCYKVAKWTTRLAYYDWHAECNGRWRIVIHVGEGFDTSATQAVWTRIRH
jgi:hypothetical protein